MKPAACTAGLEVHEHVYIAGPQANRGRDSHITHSHTDGHTLHRHPHTGPSAFTIDKATWLAVTGLRGGGQKRYTAQPTGPQLWQLRLLPEGGRS